MAAGSRFSWLAVVAIAFAVLMAGCGGSDEESAASADEAPEGSQDDSDGRDVERDGGDEKAAEGDPGVAAELVFTALEEEGQQLARPDIEFGFWRQDNELPPMGNVWFYCTRLLEVRETATAQMPERIGDPVVDTAHVPYRQARIQYAEDLDVICSAADASRDSLDNQEADVLESQIVQLYDSFLGACFEAAEAFSAYGVLPCEPGSVSVGDIGPPSDELKDELGVEDWPPEQPTPGGSSATACESTEAVVGGSAELAPGLADCTWFARPFLVEYDRDLSYRASEDVFVFQRFDEGAEFFMLAVDELADPAELSAFPRYPTIPFPEDLEEWWAQLPVDVMERADVRINGVSATRWEISGIEAEILEATGDQSFIAAGDPEALSSQIRGGITEPPPDLPEDVRETAPEFNEPRVYMIWHVRAPSGPVYVETSAFTEFGEGAEFATSVLESITFE